MRRSRRNSTTSARVATHDGRCSRVRDELRVFSGKDRRRRRSASDSCEQIDKLRRFSPLTRSQGLLHRAAMDYPSRPDITLDIALYLGLLLLAGVLLSLAVLSPPRVSSHTNGKTREYCLACAIRSRRLLVFARFAAAHVNQPPLFGALLIHRTPATRTRFRQWPLRTMRLIVV
jgi:hypothetical protein